MFVCVASDHWWYLLHVKCLCVWPVIIGGFGICCMLNVCVCVASDHWWLWYLLHVKCLCVWPVIIGGVGICCMLNVCVCGQ